MKKYLNEHSELIAFMQIEITLSLIENYGFKRKSDIEIIDFDFRLLISVINRFFAKIQCIQIYKYILRLYTNC